MKKNKEFDALLDEVITKKQYWCLDCANGSGHRLVYCHHCGKKVITPDSYTLRQMFKIAKHRINIGNGYTPYNARFVAAIFQRKLGSEKKAKEFENYINSIISDPVF